MRIFKEQIRFLNSLSCHRLSSLDEHKDLISAFENRRNPNLVKGLQTSAWDEDKDGSIAYYIVKDRNGIPLFFFSLKCVALYQHLDEEQIRERKKSYLLAQRILAHPENKEEEEIATILLERFRSGREVSDDEIKKFIEQEIGSKRDFLAFLSGDKSIDPNRHIIRVESTHSGVELVHFCVNERARDLWSQYGLPQSLGKIVFWYHIVPIIEQVRNIVGCKYLFLFAADNTEDGTLINYYQVELKLKRPDDIGTSKPIYDFNCVFMCNQIKELLKHRDSFLSNFNPDIAQDEV